MVIHLSHYKSVIEPYGDVLLPNADGSGLRKMQKMGLKT